MFKEIPNSFKIAFTCLLGALLGIFLISIATAHAQQVEYLGWSDQTNVGTVLYLGNNTYKIRAEHIGSFINSTTTLSNAEVWIYKSATSPTGTIYGVLADSFSTSTGAYTVIATSSNSYASSTITTSASKFNFAFPDSTVGENTWFLLVSSASSSGSTIRYTINLYGGNNASGTWINTGGIAGTSFAMGRYTTSGAQCASSGTMECDMASTTEAIYATGNVNVLLWSILFLLIFGFMGFAFTQGYIGGKK